MKKDITSKIVPALLSILVQIIALFVLNSLGSNSTIYYVILNIISVLIICAIINSDSSLDTKLPMIMTILIVPVFGVMFYILINIEPLKIMMKKRIKSVLKYSESLIVRKDENLDKIKKMDKQVAGNFIYLNNLSYPTYQNTISEYFPFGELGYKKMLEELEKAKHYIFLEYFIISEGTMWDGILDILKKKANEGIEVRVLYDDFGNLHFHNYYEELKKYGIKSISFNPVVPIVTSVMNNRDHRKFMIIDGEIAFTGGVNLADEYININSPYGVWKDNIVMLKGEAVWSMVKSYLDVWNICIPSKKESNDLYLLKDENADKYININAIIDLKKYKNDSFVCPYSHNPYLHDLIAEKTYINLINSSTDYIYFFTPYLIIDDDMENALIMAAKRGVDVRIIVPGIPDKKLIYEITKSNFHKLIKNGISIYKYSKGFVHSKSMVCDDELAIVGTINFDYRSLYYHFENGVLFYKDKVVKEVKKDFEDTQNKCEMVLYSNVRFGILKTTYYAIIKLISPLL